MYTRDVIEAATKSWRDWVGLAARLVLGGVLLAAGVLKVGSLESSALSVRAYQILPWDLTGPVGYALPLIEIVLGLLLIAGLFTRWAALAGSLLMLAFIIAIASVWARGISIDCGCFGTGGEIDASKTQYPLEILRDLGLLALGVWLTIRPRSRFSLDGQLAAATSVPETDDDSAEAHASDRTT